MSMNEPNPTDDVDTQIARLNLGAASKAIIDNAARNRTFRQSNASPLVRKFAGAFLAIAAVFPSFVPKKRPDSTPMQQLNVQVAQNTQAPPAQTVKPKRNLDPNAPCFNDD